jgi:hypothetical protein
MDKVCLLIKNAWKKNNNCEEIILIAIGDMLVLYTCSAVVDY